MGNGQASSARCAESACCETQTSEKAKLQIQRDEYSGKAPILPWKQHSRDPPPEILDAVGTRTPSAAPVSLNPSARDADFGPPEVEPPRLLSRPEPVTLGAEFTPNQLRDNGAKEEYEYGCDALETDDYAVGHIASVVMLSPENDFKQLSPASDFKQQSMKQSSMKQSSMKQSSMKQSSISNAIKQELTDATSPSRSPLNWAVFESSAKSKENGRHALRASKNPGVRVALKAVRRLRWLKKATVTFFVTWFDPNTYVEAECKTEVQEAFYPVYLLCHSTFALVLWLALALAGRERGEIWYHKTAGLDSVPKLDSTNLQIHTLDGADLRFQLWRCLSYQFTHVNYRHVLRNISLIFLLGIPQEGLHGHWRMATIFNLGVWGGAFFYLITDCHASVVGMSGGCYALIGMKFANLMILWNEHTQRFRKFQLVFLCFIVLVDSVCAWFDIMYTVGPRPSYSLHFGGFVIGIIFGVIFSRSTVLKHLTTMRRRIALVIISVSLIFGIGWTIKWPPQTIFERQGWRWAKRVKSATVFGDVEWYCVRCGSEECIDAWSAQQSLHDTTMHWCSENGGWKFTEDWPGN